MAVCHRPWQGVPIVAVLWAAPLAHRRHRTSDRPQCEAGSPRAEHPPCHGMLPPWHALLCSAGRYSRATLLRMPSSCAALVGAAWGVATSAGGLLSPSVLPACALTPPPRSRGLQHRHRALRPAAGPRGGGAARSAAGAPRGRAVGTMQGRDGRADGSPAGWHEHGQCSGRARVLGDLCRVRPCPPCRPQGVREELKLHDSYAAVSERGAASPCLPAGRAPPTLPPPGARGIRSSCPRA